MDGIQVANSQTISEPDHNLLFVINKTIHRSCVWSWEYTSIDREAMYYCARE